MKFHSKFRSDLCIVVLCYKSGKFAESYLSLIVKSLEDKNISDYEIILVGNYEKGSNDETPKIVKNLAERYAKVSCLTLPKEGWLGWDVRKAFEIANGNYIALIDGDGQMPANDIPRAFEIIKSDNYDLVMTYRVTRGDGLYRFILSISYNLIVRLMFPKVSVKDLNSKPKIFRKSLLDNMNLKSNGWTIDAEIMLQAYKRKARIHEVATEFLGQVGGRQSFVGYKAILEFIFFLMKQRFFGVK